MPKININRNEFEKSVGKLPLERLKDRISMLGTDLDEVNDKEIIVEIFPNRPDMLSAEGFARAFKSFIGKEKGLKEYKTKKSDYKVIVDKSVKGIRDFTACATVKGLKLNDKNITDIIQLQEKLHVGYGRNRRKCAIGIYPMEKIKFPIRYKAMNPGDIKFRPLEYDKELNGNQILTKLSTGRNYAHLLEGKKKYPVFIDADDKILSMPPIINSHETGKITEKTKDVFIEVSGFDFNVLSKCLNILATSLAEIGGEIYEIEINDEKRIISPNLKPESMKIDGGYVNKLLGLKLKEAEVKKYLEMMGYGYKNGTVVIPCYRADILHQVDLIEDIAIGYGYENFKEEIPNVSTIGQEDLFDKFKNKIKDILIGYGFLECNSYNLISEDIIDKSNFNIGNIKVRNPVNVEYNVLRNNMLSPLLKILKENKHNEYPQKIFEIGNTFIGEKEDEKLGLLICDNAASFTSSKQILDCIISGIGLTYTLNEHENRTFIPGRCGEINVKNKKLGFIGEINPEVNENFEIDAPISGFELNLKELFEIIKLL
ncbi:phenylalanine--tRNA ligase subunit beta [Candidatus Woesearchaeota archaeon]|nr:phenylalanine--tRNA ligase subunit beta [Candidatus Woesearchaeota archaeon]